MNLYFMLWWSAEQKLRKIERRDNATDEQHAEMDMEDAREEAFWRRQGVRDDNFDEAAEEEAENYFNPDLTDDIDDEEEGI